MSALAATHPLAETLFGHVNTGWSERVRDSGGRANDGFDQSPCHLSVSLAGHGCGKIMYMGLTTKGVRDEDMFGLWWHPTGADWNFAHIRAARKLSFDVCELDAESVFPMNEGDRPSTGGAPTAASGALAGSGGEEPTEVERKETARWETVRWVDLEESHSAQESDSAEEANSDSSAANDSSRTALPRTPAACSWAASSKRHRKNGAAPSSSSRCLWRASWRDVPGGHAEVAAVTQFPSKNSVFNPAIEESILRRARGEACSAPSRACPSAATDVRPGL